MRSDTKLARLQAMIRLLGQLLTDLAEADTPTPRPPAAPVASPDTIYQNLHTGELYTLTPEGTRQPLHFHPRGVTQTDDGFWLDAQQTDEWQHRLSGAERCYSRDRLGWPRWARRPALGSPGSRG